MKSERDVSPARISSQNHIQEGEFSTYQSHRKQSQHDVWPCLRETCSPQELYTELWRTSEGVQATAESNHSVEAVHVMTRSIMLASQMRMHTEAQDDCDSYVRNFARFIVAADALA